MLQLGRGPSTADTGPAARGVLDDEDGFNWAAVLQPRIQSGQRGTRHDLETASIGPRSFNRGYDLKQTIAKLSTQASIGPRSFNRGYVPPM